jgi:hypothetical protein
MTSLVVKWFLWFALGALCALFVARFVWPAQQLRRALRGAVMALRRVQSERFATVDPESVRTHAMVRDPLGRLWAEYAKTLHIEKALVAGEATPIAVRATVPAGFFFNAQVLVDTPLRAEFFRHLPGILTGIGIIGTFYGLILGLEAFTISDEPRLMREGLIGLLRGVFTAFVFSATAIGAAMIITVIEKSTLTRRYREVEELCQAIDSLYTPGAGEDYLARIAHGADITNEELRALRKEIRDLSEHLRPESSAPSARRIEP